MATLPEPETATARPKNHLDDEHILAEINTTVTRRLLSADTPPNSRPSPSGSNKSLTKLYVQTDNLFARANTNIPAGTSVFANMTGQLNHQ